MGRIEKVTVAPRRTGLAWLRLLCVAGSSAWLMLTPLSAGATGSNTFLQQKMETIHGCLDAACTQSLFPGAWVQDTLRGSGAAGTANLATGAPTQADMKMRIGSITKSFVAAVALQLVAEHKLSLNDSLQKWVPGILPYASQVTVKQLLGQTSGVPDYLEATGDSLVYQFVRGEVSRYQTWTPQQLIAMIASQPRDVIPAGQAEYSDSNYILAGLVVEAVTHDTIQHQVQSRIITPLHLTHTSFPTTQTNMTGLYANGYSYAVDADGNPIVGQPLSTYTTDFTNYNTSFVWATGAMISNPADMNTFMSALVGGHLLPPGLTAQMKQTVPITLPEGLFPPGFGAGLGIWSWDLQNVDPPNGCTQRIYGHEGEVPGYDSWSFSNGSGTRAISMGVNLLFPDWDAYYSTELPVYASLWCQ
ncbi:MAG TPA: serine hydrolase domain-containing protein [Candidatus Saccharimonadales bacterium]|nr:serine hydrolase domain-containing protein [Candidatus Saccharimonadales bacterium]